jgi:hypothetical protein
MKAKVQTTLTFALLLALTVFPIVFAQDTVGVKPGDWMKYDVKYQGTGSQAWLGCFRPSWIKAVEVRVLDVTNEIVSFREIHYGPDGKVNYERTQTSQSSIRYIIPASLEPGDKIDTIPMEVSINQWEYVDLTLNDTVPRSYGGVTREANRLMYSRLEYDAPVDLWANWTLEQCWDKPTGFLLEMTYQMYFIDNPEYWSALKIEIVDTNMWEMEKPPPQSFLWLATIPIGTVIAVAIAVKLRNNKKKDEDDKQ